MIDIVDEATRSRMMSSIRSRNTRPETLVRSALHKRGYRFRLDSEVKLEGKKKPIRPDIVLRRHKVVVFVHGCYFHQHPGCQLAYSDRRYSKFWLEKFAINKARDERQVRLMLEMGWKVAIVWECATRKKRSFSATIKELDDFIVSDDSECYETASNS